jgi:hypothetical protein
MRSDLHCLHAERLGFFCLLGALVLVACGDDPDSSGQSKSPAKGSKADTPKGDDDEGSDDSKDDAKPAKVDAGKVTSKRDASVAVVTSDPNQIRPKDPPVHEPTPPADAGAPTNVPGTQAPTDSGAPATSSDAGTARSDTGPARSDAGK